MKGFYLAIKYNTTRNDLEFYIFKRIKFIRNSNKINNILFFNIQKSIIKTFIISLSHYIEFIKYAFFIITFIKAFRNYIASLINLAIVIKILTLFYIFNIA